MATVFCFSATGNSLYVAKRIAEKINGNVISMTTDVDTCDDDMIGFVFPTYYFGLPKTVESFLKRIRITKKTAYLFAVATCGTFTGNLGGVVQKIFTTKQLKLSYFDRVRCTENYTPIYPVNDYEWVHKMTDNKVDKIIDELLNYKKKIIYPWILANRIHHLHYKGNHLVPFDSKYKVSGCTGCGTCVSICPNKNISIEDGVAVFHGDCQQCLACLHICPKKAINYNRRTIKHARYRSPNITKKELIDFMNMKLCSEENLS